MSFKRTNYIFLSLLIIVGIGYFSLALNLDKKSSGIAGPGMFPMILSVSLIIFCLISIFQTSRMEDKKLLLPNRKLILFTFGIIAAFYLSWYLIGLFYLNLIIFIFIMMVVYTHKSERKKLLLNNILFSIFITGLVYVIFNIILQISL